MIQQTNDNFHTSDNTDIQISNPADVTHRAPAWRVTKQKKYRDNILESYKNKNQKLVDFLLGKVRAFRQTDYDSRRARNRDVATFYQYYDGKEYGGFTDEGEWFADPDNDIEFQYSLPLVPAHVDAAKTLLLKTEIEYEYAAVNEEAVMDGQVAAMAEKLAEEDMARIFSVDYKILEILNLLLAGDSYRHHFVAPDSENPVEADIPVYSIETVVGEGQKVCANEDCGAKVGKMDEKCSRCNSVKIVVLPGAKSSKVTQSIEKLTCSVNQMYVPNSLSIQTDLSTRNINNSAFLIERDVLTRAKAEYDYCQHLPNVRGNISEESRMMRELERNRIKTGQTYDWSSMFATFNSSAEDLVERERIWMNPHQYANFPLMEDNWYYTPEDGMIQVDDKSEIPPNAKKIPPSTFLGDIFPHGGYICAVDENITEFNGEAIGDKWIKLVYGMRPSNNSGSGLQRLRSIADMSNDATNLQFKVLMNDADPKTFLNRKYVSRLAKVGDYNLVDNLGEDGWNSVVHRLQGSTSHPDLAGMNNNLQAFAQFTVGTFSSMGAGAPDQRAAGTATGVAAMAEEATGRFLEAIMQRKQADINSRFIVLNNRKKFSNSYQIKLLKDRFGVNVAERFFQCNLRNTIKITAKKGTDQPQSKALKIAYMTSLSQAAGQLQHHPDAPQILQYFSEQMDFPLSVGLGVQDKREANRRIAIMREKAKPFNDKNLPSEIYVPLAVKLLTAVIIQSEFETDLKELEMLNPFAMSLPDPAQLPPAPPQSMPPQPGMQQLSGNQMPQTQPNQPSLPPNPGMPGMQQQPGVAGPMPPPAPPEEQEEEKPNNNSAILMHDHGIIMDTCKDWLLGEGSQSNNQVLQCAVRLMWKLHYDRDTLKQIILAKKMGEITKVGQEAAAPPQPDPAAMQQMAEEQKKAEAEQADEERQAEGIKMLAEHEAEKEMKQFEFDLEEKGKDSDLKRDAVRADIEVDAAIELAKEEAKLAPKTVTKSAPAAKAKK